MSTRTYVADITTATTGLTVQIQRPGRIKQITFSGVGAAAGKVEISRSPATTIGTAQPDPASVLARFDMNGGAQAMFISVPCDVPVSTLDRFFVHMSGAANLGTVNLCVVEGGK